MDGRGAADPRAIEFDVPVVGDSGGAQGEYAGLDQVNATLPATLKGRGRLVVTLTVNGQAANMAQLPFQ